MTLRKRSCPAVSQICEAHRSRGIRAEQNPPKPAQTEWCNPRKLLQLLLPGTSIGKMTRAISGSSLFLLLGVGTQRGQGLPTRPLIGKSTEQMDAWGPANVIYQPLMQREVCRVHAAAWGICATELRAKGSEKLSALRGLEQLWLQGHTGWGGDHCGQKSPQPSAGSCQGDRAARRVCKAVPEQETPPQRIEVGSRFESAPLLCPLRCFGHL